MVFNRQLWQARFGMDPYSVQRTPSINPMTGANLGRTFDPRSPLASLYPTSGGLRRASAELYPSAVFVTPNEPAETAPTGGVTPTPGQQTQGGAITTERTPIPQTNPYQAALARSLMATGASTAPVASPMEGIARALTGAVGGYFAGQANEAQQARQAALGERMAQLYGIDPASVEGMAPDEIAAFGESEAKKQADARAAAAKAEEEGFKQEKGLRGEFSGLSKDFRAQRQGYERVLASAEDPSNAGDIALIFSFMRVLDPGSTVREGEFATARNAGNIPERIRAEYNRLIEGGGQLTTGQRADFVDRAGRLYGAALETHRGLEDEYAALSEAYGLDASRTVPDYVRDLEPQAMEVEVETEEPAAVETQQAAVNGEGRASADEGEGPFGAVHTDKDGNVYNWNPATGLYELAE